METSAKQRIIQFIKKIGLTVREFERNCGLSNGYLKQLRHTPSHDKMRQIIEAYPQLNRVWLLTGEGEMLNKEDTVRVPVYDIGISDNGVPFFEDAKFGCSPSGFVGAMERDKASSLIALPGLRSDGDTFVVPARGDSMVNTANPARSIPDGALVAIRKTRLSTPRWGEVYALATADGCIIKRLYPAEREGYVRCVSYNNEEFPPFEISTNEIYDIGQVVAVASVQLWV